MLSELALHSHNDEKVLSRLILVLKMILYTNLIRLVAFVMKSNPTTFTIPVLLTILEVVVDSNDPTVFKGT